MKLRMNPCFAAGIAASVLFACACSRRAQEPGAESATEPSAPVVTQVAPATAPAAPSAPTPAPAAPATGATPAPATTAPPSAPASAETATTRTKHAAAEKTASAGAATKTPPSEPAAAAPASAAARSPAAPVPAALPSSVQACGEKGQPACPLQGFMQQKLQDPFDAANLALVAQNLPRVRAFVPDASWNAGADAWNALVDTALGAAERGDAEATQKACKGCHRVWRSKYKAAYRTRALPP